MGILGKVFGKQKGSASQDLGAPGGKAIIGRIISEGEGGLVAELEINFGSIESGKSFAFIKGGGKAFAKKIVVKGTEVPSAAIGDLAEILLEGAGSEDFVQGQNLDFYS